MGLDAMINETILTEELKDQINNCGLNHFLSISEMSKIIAYNQIMTFEQSEILLEQGKHANGIYLVLSGSVNLTAKILGNGFANIEILGAGNFLGVISYTENLPSDTSIVAEKKTTCLFINKNYFDMIGAAHPEIKHKIYSAIVNQVCHRLKQMHDKITALMAESEMSARSVYGEFIHSFIKPEKITFEDAEIKKGQLEQSLSKYFTHDEQVELLQHSTLLKVSKQCTLIHAGSKNTSCYIVLQGAVQSSFVQQNRSAKLSVIGPATLFASVNAIEDGATFTITFTARENALLLRLSQENLSYFKNSKNKIWYVLDYLICRSIIALEKSINKLDIRLKIEEYNR